MQFKIVFGFRIFSVKCKHHFCCAFLLWKTTIINSDWWSAGKDIPSTKKSTAEPPLYGYLVITDSLLCPWGKKPLTFFLNTDTPLIGTLFYDLLSIRINQVLLLFSIEHRSSLSCYNHRYLSVHRITCVNFSSKSQHSFLPSFLEASQDVILFPVLRWQTPCISIAVLRRKYKANFMKSLCFPGSAIQDIPDIQVKTNFTSNPPPPAPPAPIKTCTPMIPMLLVS